MNTKVQFVKLALGDGNDWNLFTILVENIDKIWSYFVFDHVLLCFISVDRYAVAVEHSL